MALDPGSDFHVAPTSPDPKMFSDLHVEHSPLQPPRLSLSLQQTTSTITYRTYRRRWFGLIQLVLLNIIASWDWLTFAPVASSAAAYYAVSPSAINNLSTGKSASHSFSGQGNHLCETNAEWIIEDFQSGSSEVPFANFGTVSFTDCSVVEGGTTVGVNGAQILDIRQNGHVYTSCSTSGSSSVSCTYEG